jgi:insulysin
MYLAVYGRENTTMLWDLITDVFSNISSNTSYDLPATYSSTAFPPGYTGKLIHYRPEASTNTLSLYWQTPSLQEHRRNFVGNFLLRYLGHKGHGGLFDLLLRRGYASDLDADVEVEADSFELFVLQITLTDSGLENVSEVVQAVFYYTHLLATMSEEEFEQKWEDYSEVETISFDYAEKEAPNDYVM